MTLQHAGQRLLPPVARLEAGEHPALPRSSGLTGGHAGGNHVEQAVGLGRGDPLREQPLPGEWQQGRDELARRDRAR